jgi:hypothetical protein
MSDTKSKATKPAAAGDKPKRVVGPKTAFLIFKPDTPQEVVDAAKEHIDTLTMSGQALVRSLKGGKPRAFLQYTVQVDEKGAA